MLPSSSTSSWSLTEFTRLVSEHQKGVRAYIRALGVSAAWVDDLAQEAFLIAYRRQETFGADRDFGKWVRGIARNLAANERRRYARESRLVHTAVADLLAQHSESEASFAEYERTLALLRRCVDALPSRLRAILQDRYTSCDTAPVLAMRTGMTAEAVRQCLSRARALVRECLEKRLAEVQP